MKAPAFYAYAYPEPDGFKDFSIRPRQAFYSEEMKEFILRYNDVRASDQPERMVLEFLQHTYEAAAEPGRWDRENLEKDYPAPGEAVDADKGAAFPEHHREKG